MSSCANIVNRLQSNVCLLNENLNNIKLMADNLKIDQAIFLQSNLLVYLIPMTPNGIGIPLIIEASSPSSLTTTTYSGLIVLDPTGSENCVVFTTEPLLNFGQRSSTGFFEMTETLPIVVIDADPSILSTLTYSDVVSALQSCITSNDNHTVSCEAYNALVVFLKNNFGIKNLTPSVAACFYENKSIKAVSVVLPKRVEEILNNISVVLPKRVEEILNNISVVLPKRVEEQEHLIIEKVYSFEPFEPVCSWTQKGQSLIGENNNDFFGYNLSLSSDGLILAVGAFIYDNGKGQVKVYEWDGTNWTQKGQSLIGENNGDIFGICVSLSSDGLILAVGAGNYDNYKGEVKVYEWTGTLWTQKGQSLIGDNNSDGFGWSVYISSDGLILSIGAYNYDNGRGQAKVYEWNVSSWIQKGQTLIGENNNDFFGNNLSLSSNGLILAVGAYGYINNSRIGQSKIYEWTGTLWTQKGQSLIGDNNGDSFGSPIFLSSDGLSFGVGAYNYDNGKGQAKVYEWTGTLWTQKGQSLIGDNNGDYSGIWVSLSSDGLILAVGAYGYDNSKGEVKVYEWTGTLWTQKGQSLIGENVQNGFGVCVSLSS